MSTTTSDGGADNAQPQEPEAVTEGHNADQVITTDDNGTPTLEPTTSQAQDAGDDAVSEEVPAEAGEPEEAQAPVDDLAKFAKAKGYDPEALTDGERKALEMARNAEKRMHEATSNKELETTAVNHVPVDYTGDPGFDELANSVNTLLIQNKVRDFFSDNPEAREFESKMAEIVTQRPHLQQDLDALYALARSDPGREAEIEAAGGRKALTNLAQKQQQIPPSAGATNSRSYESQTITPQNVYKLVDNNDQEWFEKNHKAISRAMSGK